MSRARRSNKSLLAYACSVRSPTWCASASSMISRGVFVCSLAQVRKDARRPWTWVFSCNPVALRIFKSVASLSGRPECDGKTRPLLSAISLACSNTRNASLDNGWRCSRPLFIREPGIVHVRAARSISSHCAPRASLLRLAVRTRSSKHSFVASPAPDCLTA